VAACGTVQVTRRAALVVALAAALAAALSAASSSVPAQQRQASDPPATRYSLVHGCYDLRSPGSRQQLAPGAGPSRMQAAALGV